MNSNLPSYVCKLHKSIYDLKQAPQAWFAKLSDCLFSLGFCFSVSDSSLFILCNATIHIFILVYSDNIIIIGFDSIIISKFIKNLGLHFPVKNLGQLHYFLGIEVCHT